MTYQLKPKKGEWIIEKPNKEIIDDYIWKEKWKAERRLKIIIAMGWCE
ncbi:MAG: hypothetical protein QM500_08630 [Methylococcales bacterium]